MDASFRSALQPFVNRLGARSILTRDEVDALLSLTGRMKEIRAHYDFVRRGEQVDHACLVVDGLVGRFGQNSNGERQITCLYLPGDMADLPSVVSPKAAWGLSALSRTTILQVSHTDLRHLAMTYPGIAEALWRDCVAEGSIFSEWVVNVGRRAAITRIAHVLCEMALRSERAGLGDRHRFSFAVTQADFGDATGLTAVHVNRTLKELAMRSIAIVRKGEVAILDWQQLVSVGDFNEDFMLFSGPFPRFSEQVR